MSDAVVQGGVRRGRFVFSCPWCGEEHTHHLEPRLQALKAGDRLGVRFSACKSRESPMVYVLEVAA